MYRFCCFVVVASCYDKLGWHIPYRALVVAVARYQLAWEAQEDDVLAITLRMKSVGDQGMLVSALVAVCLYRLTEW